MQIYVRKNGWFLALSFNTFAIGLLSCLKASTPSLNTGNAPTTIIYFPNLSKKNYFCSNWCWLYIFLDYIFFIHYLAIKIGWFIFDISIFRKVYVLVKSTVCEAVHIWTVILQTKNFGCGWVLKRQVCIFSTNERTNTAFYLNKYYLFIFNKICFFVKIKKGQFQLIFILDTIL